MKNIEASIWNTMLDSEMNALYCGYIARRYATREKWLLFFIALMTASAISSLQIWKQQLGWFEWGWAWDILSFLAVVLSIAAPFLNFGNISKKAVVLRPMYQEFEGKYHKLWLKRNSLSETILGNKFAKLKHAEIAATKDDSMLPRNIKLLLICQDEIIKAKGL